MSKLYFYYSVEQEEHNGSFISEIDGKEIIYTEICNNPMENRENSSFTWKLVMVIDDKPFRVKRLSKGNLKLY